MQAEFPAEAGGFLLPGSSAKRKVFFPPYLLPAGMLC